MRRIMLLPCLILAAHCSAAMAATPVFQLNNVPAVEVRRLLEIDAASSGIGAGSSDNAIQTRFASHPVLPPSTSAVVFGATAELNDVRLDTNAVDVNFPSNPDGDDVSKKLASDVGILDDSLYFFLKDFKVRSSQKPERWAMLLVGIGFVLYQIRRRPVRTSISFYPASKTIGLHRA